MDKDVFIIVALAVLFGATLVWCGLSLLPDDFAYKSWMRECLQEQPYDVCEHNAHHIFKEED